MRLMAILAVCSISLAAGHSASLQQLEQKYRAAATLQATFLERYSENGVQVRVESGTAYFQRPGKMRWEYKEPEKSVFLVDGKYVWFYAPADHTATRMPAKKSEDWRTPITFLTTGMKLSRICSSVEAANDLKASRAGNTVYRCVLRGAESEPGERPETVLFEATPENELARIVAPQQGGMQIEFEFKNWEWNPALPKELFAFEPPPDTVIVNGVLPEAPGMRQ
ncbi:MAG TPA: outer membrane lipoprotein carrier protein LolA [Candidatus Eisenbacteria bacterium]|nr:outer membrane lipoprotein carrier protein LolA [Candidatus Eisenbacteria bacterium]